MTIINRIFAVAKLQMKVIINYNTFVVHAMACSSIG